MKRYQKAEFTYWRKPWHKWIVLALVVIEIVCVLHLWDEYRFVCDNATKLFAEEAFKAYQINQIFTMLLFSLCAFTFFACFVVGMFAKTRKAARLSEGVFFAVMAIAWIAASFVVPFIVPGGPRFRWGMLLVVLIGAAVYSYMESRKGDEVVW